MDGCADIPHDEVQADTSEELKLKPVPRELEARLVTSPEVVDLSEVSNLQHIGAVLMSILSDYGSPTFMIAVHTQVPVVEHRAEGTGAIYSIEWQWVYPSSSDLLRQRVAPALKDS